MKHLNAISIKGESKFSVLGAGDEVSLISQQLGQAGEVFSTIVENWRDFIY